LLVVMLLPFPSRAQVTYSKECQQEVVAICEAEGPDSTMCQLLETPGQESFESVYTFMDGLTDVHEDYREAFICGRLMGKRIEIQDTKLLLPARGHNRQSRVSDYSTIGAGAGDHFPLTLGDTREWLYVDVRATRIPSGHSASNCRSSDGFHGLDDLFGLYSTDSEYVDQVEDWRGDREPIPSLGLRDSFASVEWRLGVELDGLTCIAEAMSELSKLGLHKGRVGADLRASGEIREVTVFRTCSGGHVPWNHPLSVSFGLDEIQLKKLTLFGVGDSAYIPSANVSLEDACRLYKQAVRDERTRLLNLGLDP